MTAPPIVGSGLWCRLLSLILQIGVLGRAWAEAVGSTLFIINVREFVWITVTCCPRQAIGMVEAHSAINRMVCASCQHSGYQRTH